MQPDTTSKPVGHGIIAGAIVAGIVLVTLVITAFFVFRRFRRRRRISPLQYKSSSDSLSELPGAPISSNGHKTQSIGLGVEIREFEPYRQLYQAYRPRITEIDGKDVGRAELRGVKSPVELDGWGRSWIKR